MTPVAVHDGRKPLDDLVALHTAWDVDEFHRRLVLYPPGPTNRSDAFEPWCLFQHFHKDTPEGAVVTAALLVTDRRWRNASGHLMRRIDESGLVPPGDLDILAQTFLAAGPQVYWEVPGEWFDGPAIIIDLGPGSFVDDPTTMTPRTRAPRTHPATARRWSLARSDHRCGDGRPGASFAPTLPCGARS